MSQYQKLTLNNVFDDDSVPNVKIHIRFKIVTGVHEVSGRISKLPRGLYRGRLSLSVAFDVLGLLYTIENQELHVLPNRQLG